MLAGRSTVLAAASAAILLGACASVPACAQVLITEHEAKLPTAAGAAAFSSRGVTRRPRVELISPAKGKAPSSPLHLQIKFAPYSGATVDPTSVKVTYMKSPAVDLTSRVKDFTQPTGIDVPAAEVPHGDHIIRVDVTDSEGRTAISSFTLKVGP
jgi:hypothetical protein